MPREEILFDESMVEDLDLSGLDDINVDGDEELTSEVFLEKAISSQDETLDEDIHPGDGDIGFVDGGSDTDAPVVKAAEEIVSEEVVGAQGEEPQTDVPQMNNTTPDRPAWTSPLQNVEVGQILRLKEYGQEYIFKRVMDPNGNSTSKFEVFYREEGDNPWQTLNGLLTDRYVVASLAEFVSNLNNEMNLVHIPHTTREPWNAVWFGKSDVSIEYFDDETSRMVFSLITGADDATISNLSSNISLTVSNSYNGKRSLRVDYNINSTGVVTSSSGSQNMKLVDFFSLGKFSHRVIHNASITQIAADISDIQIHIEDTITTLKGYTTNIDSIVEKISKGFKKDNKNQFLSLCENMVPEYRKLYYVLICASAVLGGNYSIGEHVMIRSLVDKLFEEIF